MSEVDPAATPCWAPACRMRDNLGDVRQPAALAQSLSLDTSANAKRIENSVTGGEGGTREDPAGRQADAERLMGDASQLAARAAGRAREELEDVWAEAQALRHQGSGVWRLTLVYEIAGLINLGERVAGAARGAAEEARAVQHQEAKPPDADDQRS